MAKKKKTQLKPIARGFATTSLPKKIIPEDVPEPEPLSDETSADKPSGDGDAQGILPAHSAVQNQIINIVSTEELNLQILVDRFQEKTEKELSRYLLFSTSLSCTC